jgi:hypothetical protein
MKKILYSIALLAHTLSLAIDPNTTKVETVPVLSIPGNPLAQPSITTSKVQTVATTQPVTANAQIIETRRPVVAPAQISAATQAPSRAPHQIAIQNAGSANENNVLAALKPIAPKAVPQK